MQGWFLIWSIAGLEVMAALALLRCAVRNQMDLALILIATLILMKLIAASFDGDASWYLPHDRFSDGFDGKDRIAMMGGTIAFLAAPALAAAGLCVLKWVARLLKRTGVPGN